MCQFLPRLEMRDFIGARPRLLRELVLEDALGDASTPDAERDRHGQTQGAECDRKRRQDHRSRYRDLLERHCARQNQNQPTNGSAQQPR